MNNLFDKKTFEDRIKVFGLYYPPTPVRLYEEKYLSCFDTISKTPLSSLVFLKHNILTCLEVDTNKNVAFFLTDEKDKVFYPYCDFSYQMKIANNSIRLAISNIIPENVVCNPDSGRALFPFVEIKDFESYEKRTNEITNVFRNEIFKEFEEFNIRMRNR